MDYDSIINTIDLIVRNMNYEMSKLDNSPLPHDATDCAVCYQQGIDDALAVTQDYGMQLRNLILDIKREHQLSQPPIDPAPGQLPLLGEDN